MSIKGQSLHCRHRSSIQKRMHGHLAGAEIHAQVAIGGEGEDAGDHLGRCEALCSPATRRPPGTMSMVDYMG